MRQRRFGMTGPVVSIVIVVALISLGIWAFFSFVVFGGISTSSNVSIDAEDIQYFKDDRYNLCFAVVASGRFFEDASGLGFTSVPCDSIPEFRQQDNQTIK